MNREKKILIVIPARGGSKGIPRKNLRLLNGMPLISHSIRTALASRHHPVVVVTSDDQEILTVAAKCGARTHQRSAELAGDSVTLDPVVYDAYKANCPDADIVVTLQPTSPLLKSETLDRAIDQLIASDGADTIISVIEDTHLTWRKGADGQFVPNYEKRVNRQQLPQTFKETGGFVISRSGCVTVSGRFGRSISLCVLDAKEAIDIDSLDDWAMCEYYLQKKKIVFSVTGHNDVGMGHVYNALLLASGLTTYDIEFVVDAKSLMAKEKIESFHYPVFIQDDSDPLVQCILQREPHVVISDRLDTDAAYMDGLRCNGIKLINIEDLGPGAAKADLVINAMYPESAPLPKHYFGHNYFCLRDEFILSRPKELPATVGAVLVSFGGADPNNLTKRVLDSIYDLCISRDIRLNVILGYGYKEHDTLDDYRDRQGVEILSSVRNISEHIRNADIVFTSGGRTTYETASLGVPSIVIFQNPREATHFFASPEYGFLNLGLCDHVTPSNIANAFLSVAGSASLRRQMRDLMLSVDLKGGRERVIALIRETIEK